MMSRPILYSFRRCPYAMRARMALYYSEQLCELREVALKNKPAEMLAASEKGTVPVLIVDHGLQRPKTVIDESLDVMFWALQQYDPDRWLDDMAHIDCPQSHPLVQLNDEVFTQWLNRYKYADRHPEATQVEYFEKCREVLQEFDQNMVRTESGSYFICSPKLSFLDSAIFPFVRQCLAVDANLSRSLALPKLLAWHNSIIESDLFKSIMSKHPVWVTQQTEVIEFGPSRDHVDAGA